VWNQGGLWVAPTSARVHNIVSTSANDTAAGTGARTILVEGLDSSFNEISETVTLAGLTNVATANAYTRINSMMIVSAGSGKTNAGIIRATAQTDGTVTSLISVGYGLSHCGIYTVPNGKTCSILYGYVSALRPSSTSDSMISLQFIGITGIDTANPVSRIVHFIGVSMVGTNSYQHDYVLPFQVAEKTDLIIRITYSTDNDMRVAAGFGMILKNN
jgi:hypothetical protein